MVSRRDFLRTSSLGLPALAFWPSTYGGAGQGTDLERPTFGFYFEAEDMPRLKERFASHSMFAGLRQRLADVDREEARQFLTSEVDYNNKWKDLQRVSQIARQMAFYYAMAGDRDAAALARRAVRTMMKFPKWDYFLEAGTKVVGIQRASDATLATALSADWLGTFVDEEERADWLRTMSERGCEACFQAVYGMRYPGRVVGWTVDESSGYFEKNPGSLDLSNWPTILDATNLKVVPAGALALGALAYKNQFGTDGDTERWLEQAVYSLRSAGSLFRPDGSYTEGVGYANYATLHMAQALAALRRVEGIDLYDVVNWPGLVEYLREMSLPTAQRMSRVVNFGDSWGGNPSAVPFWVADRSHDAQAQWFGTEMTGKHNMWSLLWYAPDQPAEAPSGHPHLWHSDLDWITARTGYAPDDLVVALRSGGPTNHEHADRNSLIVKCFGEPLVVDPQHAPYGHAHPAWMMRTTAGHSALLIDGESHQYHDGSEGTNASDAAAAIVREGERDGYSFWTSDATPAYQLVLPDVTSVTRTVVVLYELPAVLVFDKVTKKETPSRIQARFFAKNTGEQGARIEEREDGFLTVRPTAALRGTAHAPGGVRTRARQLPIPEETARKHPFAEVGTQEAELESFLITVLQPERGEGGAATAAITASSDGIYDIALQRGERSRQCRVFDTERIPEFDVA